MMDFISSESAERHRYIDAVLAEVQENLAINSGVLERMDNTVRLETLSLAKESFVPNVRHNVISIPHAYLNTDATPIVAARRAEPLYLGSGFELMTSLQSKAVRAEHEPIEFEEHVDAMKDLLEPEIGKSDINADMAATGLGAYVTCLHAIAKFRYVNHQISRDTLETHRVITGRPVVVMLDNRANKFVRSLSTSGKLVHELVHVSQMNNQPMRMLAQSAIEATQAELAIELPAYRHAGYYERGLYESYDTRYQGNNDVYSNAYIEIERQKHATAERPYEPDEQFVNWLLELGVLGHTNTIMISDINAQS